MKRCVHRYLNSVFTFVMNDLYEINSSNSMRKVGINDMVVPNTPIWTSIKQTSQK